MTEFEFFFSFYGLLLGLSVAAVVSGLAAAIRSRKAIVIGWLTPLLALFVLLDITSFWLFAWDTRTSFQVNYRTMYLALAVSVAYYFSASLVVPKNVGEWPKLDEYYWKHKRIVLPGIIFANVVITVHGFLFGPQETYRGREFAVETAAYFIPVVLLLFTRRRGIDAALLGWLALLCVAGSILFNW
jgi:hypothetical protein